MSKVSLEVMFSAVDSLYFRGSRPHSAAGASTLASEFPPSMSTLSGTVRTRLGDALKINWNEIKELDGKAQTEQSVAGNNLGELIGSSQNTGLLEFSEPRIYKNNERLYPVPALILQTDDKKLVRLELGQAVHCDLGNVRLPKLPDDVESAKPLENAWITEAGLNLFLQGKLPKTEHIIKAEELFSFESRLGIGRDVALATVKSGLLYQTEHLRLADDVAFSIAVTLPSEVVEPFKENILNQPLQRFGGEGRMAHLQVRSNPVSNLTPAESASLLMLLTDMLPHESFNQAPLMGLTRMSLNGVDCWEGEIHGVPIRLHAIVSSKAKRFGGWDIRHNRPREVQSYVPAGSCFFVEHVSDTPISQLTGCQIGRRTDFGFGTLISAC